MNVREHLLTCLIEECSEIQKCATKILRFGENDRFPNPQFPNATSSNVQDISDEIDDLIGVMVLLKDEGVLLRNPDQAKILAKKIKVKKYMNYAREHGSLV